MHDLENETANAIAAVEQLALALAQWPAPAPAKPPTGPAAPLPTEIEAYRILDALPDTPWERIEQTRRAIVQGAHPDQLAKLSPARQAKARADAAAANAASLLLNRLRC